MGYAIVKMQDRWPKPFLVRFPLFPVSASVEPSQDKRKYFKSDSLKLTVEQFHSALNEAIWALPETDTRVKNEDRISDNERSLLTDIAEHPLSVVTERYEWLGWRTAHTGTKKRKLLEMGFIVEEKVSVPKGSVTLLKPTEKGRELLASWGIRPKALPKNASLQHEYYKEMVSRDYEAKGYKVVKEYPLGGGMAVDIVATKGDERIAIEVETGKSDVEENMRKCKEAGFDRVFVIKTR